MHIRSEPAADSGAASQPRPLASVLDQIAAVVGEEHVRRSPAELEMAARVTTPNAVRPAGIVYPGSRDEVVAVVRIANDNRVALWPCSRGNNWGYGSATPARAGTVVLSLERLDRIVEVDDALGYAVVEPGVSYRQLKAHLLAHHPGLWCDCTDGPPDGSVIGNALDRGLGVTHYADHFGTLCGLEVVLPSGEIVETGGGPAQCRTLHTHKWGVGPYLEGLFSQGNYGIVTRAGVWLMPKPESFCSFQFELRRPEDLPRLVDAVRTLMLNGTLASATHLINEIVTLAVLAQYPPSLLRERSRLPDHMVRRMCDELCVRPWTLGGGIQGSAAHVRTVRRALRATLAPLGRLEFLDDRTVALAQWAARMGRSATLGPLVRRALRVLVRRSVEMLEAAPHVHAVLQGTPSDFFVRHAYFKSALPKPDVAQPDRDDVGLIWFAPIAPMTGQHVGEVLSICRPLFEEHGFDFYAALLTQNARSMIVLMSIFYLKDDPAQVESATRLYEALGASTARAGYQPYRAAVMGMGKLAETAPAFNALARTLKAAVDPHGTLAPGKYGI